MPAATPAVFVANLLSFAVDPDDPINNTLITWEYQLLFCGDYQWAQGSVVIANDASKAAIKTAINNVMIAGLQDLGFTLTTGRIFTTADFAG